MIKSDWTLKAIALAIALFLGIIALGPLTDPPKAMAQTSRFDHVFVVTTMFLYKGMQGLLLLDKRNGNVWFVPRVNEGFKDPVFLIRMQFEKLDQAPQ